MYSNSWVKINPTWIQKLQYRNILLSLSRQLLGCRLQIGCDFSQVSIIGFSYISFANWPTWFVTTFKLYIKWGSKLANATVEIHWHVSNMKLTKIFSLQSPCVPWVLNIRIFSFSHTFQMKERFSVLFHTEL